MKRKRSIENAQGLITREPSGAAVMQTAVTDALTRALFAEWAERGYGALSLEAVAKRAGVGKAALYRRWPSKFAFVSDRIETVGIGMARDRDTGSLRGDIRALLGDVRRTLRHPLVRRILPDLYAEMQRSPDLAAAIRGRVRVERRAVGTAILTRGVARGEVPQAVQADLFNDAVAAMLYWRMIVTGQRVVPRDLDDLADFILQAVAGCAKG